MIGSDIGSVTRKKVNAGEAPSTWADSRMSLGMPRNAAVASRITNGVQVHASAIATAHSAFSDLPSQSILAMPTSEIEPVHDPPLAVEHVLPKKADHDRAEHHRHQRHREQEIPTLEITLKPIGGGDSDHELDRERGKHELPGEDEALPDVLVGQQVDVVAPARRRRARRRGATSRNSRSE